MSGSNPSEQAMNDVREAILTYDADTEFHYQHVFANAFPVNGRSYHETTISAALKRIAEAGEITRIRPGVYVRQPSEPTVRPEPVVKEPKKLTLVVVHRQGGKTFATDTKGELYILTKVAV